MNVVLTGLLVSLVCTSVSAQNLVTRAEATDFRETSRYADVIQFVNQLPDRVGDIAIHKTSFGYSMEGRALPLVVLGGVDSHHPENIRATGKVRVFVQANIHAGEVDGKEAILRIMREVAMGEHADWFDEIILLVAPIYNADGNERVRLTNRPRQHGPVAGMGQRPNSQGLDLNRDHMKLESPEARSLVRLMNEYDPHVLIDLHTTNGTVHGYHLTYSPSLNPNTAASLDGLLRDELLPWVTEDIENRYGWHTYHYGNMPDREPRGWYTFDHRPRFNNNYIGLRNRIAILSESYSYATFEDRILASERFVESILDFISERPDAVVDAVNEASVDVRGQRLSLSARFPESPPTTTILLGGVVAERNPYSGAVMLRRTQELRPVEALDQVAFEGTRPETVPGYYLIPVQLSGVVQLLEDHGVEMNHLIGDFEGAERFRIDSTSVAPREFQGHRERSVYGDWESIARVEGEWLQVDMGQRLARLVFYLLEPMSDDGVANWNFLDDAIDGSDWYPILRIPHAN